MKEKYTQIFSLSANDHNVDKHDAVMVKFTSEAEWGSAQLYPFARGVPMGVQGDPRLGDTNNVPATGPVMTISGGTYESQIIVPIQFKGTGSLTNCTVFGLKR